MAWTSSDYRKIKLHSGHPNFTRQTVRTRWRCTAIRARPLNIIIRTMRTFMTLQLNKLWHHRVKNLSLSTCTYLNVGAHAVRRLRGSSHHHRFTRVSHSSAARFNMLSSSTRSRSDRLCTILGNNFLAVCQMKKLLGWKSDLEEGFVSVSSSPLVVNK